MSTSTDVPQSFVPSLPPAKKALDPSTAPALRYAGLFRLAVAWLTSSGTVIYLPASHYAHVLAVSKIRMSTASVVYAE